MANDDACRVEAQSTMKTPTPEEEAIFSAACGLKDKRQRNDYLDAACKNDTQRRERIENLLKAADEAAAFFDRDAIRLADSQSDTAFIEKPGGVMRYFGDYEIETEIARGGMGVIYKARQTSLNRDVAVKMILSGNLANETEIKRFRTEAEAAANLQHRNIVSIHEVGVHKGQHYYSMDLVVGGNMEQKIKAGLLSAGDAARYLKSIAEAVEYAHSRDILHRDLKPQNILIDGDDQPMITDFGLAKLMQSGENLTVSGNIMGSPGFMAPEQAAGDSTKLDPRTDVYGLGGLLYHMLTGRAPIQGENVADTLRRVAEEDPAPPRRLNPKVSADLETICLKCLAKQPGERYQSAGELAEELERLLNYEPIQARPAGAVRKTWTWWQKNPWKLVGILGLTTLAMIAALTGLWEKNALAVEQLKFPGEDVRTFLNPFGESPAASFLLALPCWLLLFHLGRRAFQRVLADAGEAGRFSGLPIPVYATCGVAAFLFAMSYLLNQIRAWVWSSGYHGPENWLLAMELSAVACCFALAWIGMIALWEVLGTHDSALFKANVHERLKRDQEMENRRFWKLSDLLVFCGSGVGMLVLSGGVLFLLLNEELGETQPAVAALILGCGMVAGVAAICRRWRRGSLGRTRGILFSSITVFIISLVIMILQMRETFIPLTFGWFLGGFAVAFLGFTRSKIAMWSASRSHDTSATHPSASTGTRLRLVVESIAFLVGLMIALHLVENFRGERAWQATRAEMERVGMSLGLDWIQEPSIPQEENFFAALPPELYSPRRIVERHAGGVIVAAPENMPSIPATETGRGLLPAFSSQGTVDLEDFRSFLKAQSDDESDATDPADAWIARHAEFWNTHIEAARRPRAQLPRVEPLDHFLDFKPAVMAVRQAAQAFTLRGHLAIEARDAETAADCARVLARFRELGESDGYPIFTGIGMAAAQFQSDLTQHGLQQRIWSSEQLQELQWELEKIDTLKASDRAWRAEIATYARIVQDRPFVWILEDQPERLSFFFGFIPKGWSDQNVRHYARFCMNHLLPCFDVRANRFQMDRVELLETRLRELRKEKRLISWFGRLGVPSMRKWIQNAAKKQTHADMTEIACALERYRLAKGAYPDSLNDLVPDWIAKIPHEVSTGDSLIYRPAGDDSFVFYALGPDGEDDGGRSHAIGDDAGDWVWMARAADGE